MVVKVPVAGVIVAVVVSALLQVPAGVASLSVIVPPRQTDVFPAITAGIGFTLSTAVAMQPVGSI